MANSREVIIKYESYPNTDSLKRPTIKIKFNPQDKQSFSCLVDSGADCSIFPLSIGEKLEIDFSESDPLERPPQQMSGKMECKCYPKATSIYGPWGKEPVSLEILWADSNEINPVLGRKGFFDKFREVCFSEQRKELILRK